MKRCVASYCSFFAFGVIFGLYWNRNKLPVQIWSAKLCWPYSGLHMVFLVNIKPQINHDLGSVDVYLS